MLRFAPSPYHDLHLRDLRIALISYLVSRQRGEGFLLRFADTEESRNESREETIKRILEKFAIHTDREMWQSEQRGRHQQLAVKLLERGDAFLCTCDTAQCRGDCAAMGREEIRRIRTEKTPFTLRIRRPREAIVFNDIIAGETVVEPAEVDRFVLLRTDGTPTPLFADTCDDILSGITLVIQESTSLADAARAIHIRRSLGYDTPIDYAHLPSLRIEETHGALAENTYDSLSVARLLREGFLPDAIINTLLSLGSKPPTELFTLPEAVEWFDLSRLSPDPVSFELRRLRTLNREHLRRMDDRTLSAIFRFADPEIGRLAKLYLDEAATINELEERLQSVFSPKECDSPERDSLHNLSTLIVEGPYFRDYEELTRYLSEHSGISGSQLDRLLLKLFTGSSDGPSARQLYPHIKSYITEIARCQH